MDDSSAIGTLVNSTPIEF